MDANAIVADPNLGAGVWKQLEHAVSAGRVRVVAPEIALEEASAKRAQTLRAIGRKLREDSKYAPAEVRSLVLQAQDEAARLANEYEQTLRSTWAGSGFDIVSTAQAAHLTVARRAIRRIRPFNDQGNGYRDTLHWLTLLEIAHQSPDEDITLVSNDGIFSTKTNELVPSLVDEFQSVSSASVSLCRQLSQLVVPGHYVSDPVDAHQYAASLGGRLIEELSEDYSLRRIRTSGIYAPSSDWDDLLKVTDLNFTSIMSRNVENQADPDIQFIATANFTVRGTYLTENDDSEAPQVITHDVEMPVQLSGIATTRHADQVGALRDLEAVHTGDDLMLVEAIKRAGWKGLRPALRAELEQVFGEAAVTRVEEKLFGSAI